MRPPPEMVTSISVGFCRDLAFRSCRKSLLAPEDCLCGAAACSSAVSLVASSAWWARLAGVAWWARLAALACSAAAAWHNVSQQQNMNTRRPFKTRMMVIDHTRQLGCHGARSSQISVKILACKVGKKRSGTQGLTNLAASLRRTKTCFRNTKAFHSPPSMADTPAGSCTNQRRQSGVYAHHTPPPPAPNV